MIISDQAPPGQDHLLRRIAELEQKVRELAAARSLEAATIKGGSLRVVDNTGELKVQVGLLPDGSYGLAAVNPDGELVALSTLAFGIKSADVGDIETTTSQNYTDLPTAGPVVSGVQIGSSGRCLVILSAQIWGGNSSGFPSSTQGFMSFRADGPTPVAPSDGTKAATVGNNDAPGTGGLAVSASRVVLVSGLLAGSYTFTAKYRSITSGASAEFADRNLTVLPY